MLTYIDARLNFLYLVWLEVEEKKVIVQNVITDRYIAIFIDYTEFKEIKLTMLRLRAHHLICLQFFKGEGYSLEFIENLEILRHLLNLLCV